MTIRPSVLALAVALGLSFPAVAADGLPVNPDVTPENIAATICVPGYSKSIRPYVSTMQAIKREFLTAIGEPWERRNRYQLDHLIPICAGGDVIDRRNLVLQPIEEAKQKDGVEACVCQMICVGAMPLREAQERMWRDWRALGKECGARAVIGGDE